MMMSHSCQGHAPVEITTTLHVSGTNQAGLTWSFDPTTQNGVSIDADGTMHFETKPRPVFVTLVLDYPDDAQANFYKGRGFNVFGFADAYDDGYSTVQVVQPGHAQFDAIAVTDSPQRTVSFCYMNHRKQDEPGHAGHYQWSRYVIYLGEPKSYPPLQVDPRIGNGAFSGSP